MFAIVNQYQRVPPTPPGRLAAPRVSIVFTEPPPPEPSITRMIGRRKSCAISSAISGLADIEASAEPPRTVKSSPTTTTVRPSTLPRPNTQLAGVRCLSSLLSSYSAMPEIAPISWKEFLSISLSMRSRTVSRPWSCWRLTLSTPPISRANASRRASSSSSGFQFIRILRLDDLVVVARHRKRLSFDTIGEDVALGAFEQTADCNAELEHLRRHLPVQRLLGKQRGEKAARHDDEGLILRRPHRHRAAIDMRAPGTAADDVAVFAQMVAVVLDARLQQSRVSGTLALHFGNQGVADIGIERCGVGKAGRGARHRDAAAGAFVQAERVRCPREFEIDQMEAIGNHEADGTRQLIGDVLQPQPDQVAKLQPLHHRGAHRHRAWTDTVFLVARQIDELAHPRQRVREPRYRRSRQTAAAGNFQIAQSRLMTLEAAQDVERPRHHLNHITLACEIAGEHSLFAKPFRASSHILWLHSALRNKIPLAEQTTSGNLRPQQKAVREDTSPSDGPRRAEMPDIKIVTEVAGRVCALPVTTGGNIGDGDEIA